MEFQDSPKLTKSQVLCMLVLGFQGMEMSAVLGFTSQALISMGRDPTIYITDEHASWIGAAVPLMALIGSLFGGKMIGSFGRRKVSIITGIPSILAWICIAFASSASEVITARLLSGFCLGVQQVAATVYASETIHYKVRPQLEAIPAISLSLGFILINICGVLIDWRGMAWFGAATCLPLFISLIFILPETPYFLLRSGKENDTLEILQWLRSTTKEAKMELYELKQSLLSSSSVDLIKPPYRWPLSVAILLHVTQQATGLSSIISYTGLVFKWADPNFDPGPSTLLNIVIYLVTCIYVSSLFTNYPRKYFLKVSSQLIVMSLLVISTYFWIKENESFQKNISNFGPHILAFNLLLFNLGIGIGWGSIPWMFIGESFPLKMRGSGAGIITAINWAANFFVTKTFIFISLHFGPYVIFLVYALGTYVGTDLLMRYMPETFGMTDAQLEKYYKDLYKYKIK